MIEVLAVLLMLASVFYTIRQKIACWPLGIAATGLYFFVFMGESMYANMLLQLVFIAQSVWAWWNWSRPDIKKVTEMGNREWGAVLVLLVVLVCCMLGCGLMFFDSVTAALGLVGMYLLGKKKLESWVFWILSDIILIGVFLYMGMYPSVLLYSVLLIMSITGLVKWNQIHV